MRFAIAAEGHCFQIKPFVCAPTSLMSTPTPLLRRSNAVAVSTRPSPQPRSRINVWGPTSVVGSDQSKCHLLTRSMGRETLEEAARTYRAAPQTTPRPRAWLAGRGSACAGGRPSVSVKVGNRRVRVVGDQCQDGVVGTHSQIQTNRVEILLEY